MCFTQHWFCVCVCVLCVYEFIVSLFQLPIHQYRTHPILIYMLSLVDTKTHVSLPYIQYISVFEPTDIHNKLTD